MNVLIVTTSNAFWGEHANHPTGVWLDEFTIPYMKLHEAGVELTVASPRGGQMPIDPRTLPNEDQKIAWAPALVAASATVALGEIQADPFDAIFIPGGHGPMFDLPDDTNLQALLTNFHAQGKLIGAVCHGPCGLVNARRADGEYLVKGVTLTSYTYEEEVAAKLDTQVPFILEHRLRERGANFIARENRANHVERDGLFITGQNPWSSESVAMAMLAALRRTFPPQLNTIAEEIRPARTVAEFPAPSFIENIVIGLGGAIYIGSLEEGAVYGIEPGAKPVLFAKLPVVAGLALLPDGALLAASTNGRDSGLFRLSRNAEPALLAPIPQAALLNGLIHLTGSRYLVADSYAGRILEADIATGETRMWLEHIWLAHAADPFHPVPQFPGVNGLKRFGDSLYVSSTEQQKIIRIPLGPAFSAGEPEVFMTLINLDDFAFDAEGNLYGATHIYNTLVKINPARQVSVVAGLEQGMAGSTAVAFGRTEEDRNSLYVTTNGGMSRPPEGGIQPGRVVRVDVGKPGYFAEAV